MMTAIRLSFLLLLLAMLACAGQVHGQAAPERLYQVELVVFAFEGDRSQFHAAPGMEAPRSRGAVRLRTTSELTSSETAPGPRLFELLDAGQGLSLARVRQRLDQSAETRVLGHFAWRQPMFAFQSGRRVRLDPVETEAGHRVEGTVALQRGRFINLDVDLALTDPPDPWSWSDSGAASAPLSYRLRERRQLRLGETHYFDHGAFGVIARVERWLRPEELAEPEDAE